MHVIGTAGHVDHGKSTLVAALTGINPDRLKEEKEREMTIELGFAWMDLPNGETIGIVDVPGHRDFIENMLAGVGGIDAALFIVAADEGVMPQTREHLAILDLLQVERGVIALTKVDLAPDSDWLDLVEEDVRGILKSTTLAEAPIVRVSAKTGQGLEELKLALATCLDETPPRVDLGRPRLPIDRVFTIAGFGTVVTGTLQDGVFQTGDEVVVLPSGLKARVRGLQTHREKEEFAVPGSRTAVNLSGVNVEQINRGDVIAHPHQYTPTQRIDAQFRAVSDLSSPLRHSGEVKLFFGASEVLAHVRLIGIDQLAAGQSGFLQLELREPIVAVRGDRYILRRPSPGETIGGGRVLDTNPKNRYKRFEPEVLAKMKALAEGTPAEVFLQAAQALGVAALKDIIKQSRLDQALALSTLEDLVQSNQMIMLETGSPTSNLDRLASASTNWMRLSEQAVREVREFHNYAPLKFGMPREALKSRLKLDQRVFTAAMRKWIQDGGLVEAGMLIQIPGFKVTFKPAQKSQIDHLIGQFNESPWSPPSVKECQAAVGDEVYHALVDLGTLKQVSDDVVFRTDDFNQIQSRVTDVLRKNQSLTVAQFRDLFNTSRKYALAALEYMDEIGVTERVGDERRLKSV